MSPLPIGGMPYFVGRENLHQKLPRSRWQELRVKALAIYQERCGICGMTDVTLSLHEQWTFFWVQEVPFTPESWKRHAEEQRWIRYEEGKSDYCAANGESKHLCMFSYEEDARLRALIISGFPPYVRDWANTQNNLALVYEEVGDRVAARMAMQQSVTGYRHVGMLEEAQEGEDWLAQHGEAQSEEG